MKTKVMTGLAFLLLFNTSAFADSAEDRWNSTSLDRTERVGGEKARTGKRGDISNMSSEKQARITQRASELGVDINTDEGRRAVRDSMRAEGRGKR
ncbi:hypothetical protein ACFL2V_04105 [Pseudomonadota bacterium]